MIESHTPPSEIRVTNKGKLLFVTFDDNRSYEFTSELLRVESPSAEVQGHSADEKRTIGGKVGVTILSVEPVGNYAVKINFSDGHDTGLYTWDYFSSLGENQSQVWTDYLVRMKDLGLSRDN